jgi:TfoX/Sxy family transcriptional regulator of competence genes
MAYDEQLAARIRDIVTGEPGVSERKMFGGLAFLVNGNMAVAASHEGGILLHVDPEQTEALLAEPFTDPFVMRGRRMAGWLRVLPEGLEDDADLERWAGLGITYARGLPPK